MSKRETEREEEQMIRVAVEVHSGTARFRVAVQAKSIQRALSPVGGRFPGRTCRVKIPKVAEGFFLEGPTTRETVEQPQELAAWGAIQ